MSVLLFLSFFFFIHLLSIFVAVLFRKKTQQHIHNKCIYNTTRKVNIAEIFQRFPYDFLWFVRKFFIAVFVAVVVVIVCFYIFVSSFYYSTCPIATASHGNDGCRNDVALNGLVCFLSFSIAFSLAFVQSSRIRLLLLHLVCLALPCFALLVCESND